MARHTKQQTEELKHIKSEINAPKHRLIDLLRRVEEISPTQAKDLGRIIARLEAWQNG